MALTAEEQLRNSEMRDWARDNGWPDLGERGNIPAAVKAAYYAFTGAAAGGDDGADFAGAAAAMGLRLEPGASPLDDDDQAPEDVTGGGQAPPPPPPASSVPAGDNGAPVSSLDEARQRVAASKAAPAWAGKSPGGRGRQDAAAADAPGKGRRRRASQPAPPPDPAPIVVDQRVLDDMAGKLSLVLMTPVRGWAKLDPHCGGAAIEHGPAIIDAWVPVLARSQAVVRLFTIDALFFQLFAAIQATWPLAEAIYDHHLSAAARERQELEQRQAAQQQTSDDDLAMYPSMPVMAGHVPDYHPPRARM